MQLPATATRNDARGWQGLGGDSIELLTREDLKFTSAPVAAEIFSGLGFDVRLATESDVDLSPNRILFVGGNPRFYKRTLTRVASRPPAERPCVIVWHTEPLPMPTAAGLRPERLTFRELGKIVLRDRRINDHYSNARYLRALGAEGVADALVVALKAYQAYLAEVGIQAEFVPLGYHPMFGRLLDRTRDIDLLFLGDFRLRRRRRILRRLRRDGLDILTLGDYSDPDLWGEARTELMNRTKIALNIPRLEGHFPDVRFVVAMATGALLVSEPMYLPDPYIPGVHYVESSVEDMADTVREYLADEEARRRITREAHAFVTQQHTLERSFEELLTLASDGRAQGRE